MAALLWVLTATGASAQNATLNGFVTDAATGEALEDVNVVLQAPDGEMAAGTVTNRDGLYLLRVPAGRYLVRATFVGYLPHTDTLNLVAGRIRTFNLTLQPAAGALDEVVVQTDRQDGVARVTAGQHSVRPAEIALVPSPDVSGDLMNYLTTLPGFVATGDRGGQLFIRGGEPSQNFVQLDGMVLYQPFHILGFYSAFPADILSRTDIYAGGYGAKFGERISSVIDVWTREGNKRRFGGSASVSPFMATAHLEGPVVPDRVSFLASFRRSMVEQGAEPLLNERLPFDFGDAFAKLHAEVTPRMRLALTGIRTHDRGTLVEPGGGVPPEEIRWKNQAFGLRYLLLPHILPISSDLRVSHSRLDAEQGSRDDPSRVSSIWETNVSLDGAFYGPKVDAQAGIVLRLLSSRTDLGGLYQNTEFKGSSLDHLAFYAEPEWKLGRGLRVRAGARLQFYYIRIDPYVEPRLRVVWDRGRHHFSGALGYYTQEILGLTDRRDAASVFTAWTNIPKFNPGQPDVLAEHIPRAIHAIAGYRTTPAPWLEFSVEGFQKWYKNLFVPEWTAFPRFTTRLQPADGQTLGFDARVEVRRPPFYGYLNYGLSSTRYEARQASLALWYGRETLDYRPPHDRRHQLNVLLSTTALGFAMSARWEFGSGLPYSRAVGFDGFVLVDDIVDVRTAPASRRVIYARPYDGLLPAYHRLDVSIDRTFDLGRARVTVLGSVMNVYDRRNLFYLDVFTLRRVDQLPVLPSLGIKVEFN